MKKTSIFKSLRRGSSTSNNSSVEEKSPSSASPPTTSTILSDDALLPCALLPPTSPTASSTSSRRRSSAVFKTLERKLSMISLSGESASSLTTPGEKCVDPALLANIRALQTVIANKQSRQNLINAGLAQFDPKSNLMEKIRFCSCVEEFKRERDSCVKLAKGRKILSIFVESGSMFQCSGISESSMMRLRRGLFDEYDLLVTQFLEELAQQDVMMANCMRELNAMATTREQEKY